MMNKNLSRPLVLASLTASLLAAAWPADTSARGFRRPETVPEINTRVIVKYPGASTSVGAPSAGSLDVVRALAARLGVSLRHLRRMSRGADIFELSAALTPAELRQLSAELIASDPSIEYVEQDTLMMPLAWTSDPESAAQWNFFDPVGGIGLDAAWQRASGAGVVVAVVDTGVLPHADLNANLLAGHDFISRKRTAGDGDGRDDNAIDQGDWYRLGQCFTDPMGRSHSSWHGTHVAGTIAAVANNGIGVVGIAPDAKILPLRALGRCGGYTSDIADAVQWASGGMVPGADANPTPARVINLSLGASGACSITYQAAINDARKRGSVVVVAAGNSRENAAGYTPANCQGVIAVGASDRQGKPAYYSNFGPVVDVYAPGGDMRKSMAGGILSTMNAGLRRPGADIYLQYQGTSMAAPHVAGVAALMLSRNPALTPDQVEALLKSSTRAFPGGCGRACDAGMLDAPAAVDAAAAAGAPH